MKSRRYLSALAASAGMLILILDGKTALSGAAEGVELCLKTLIPSLFPFFVLSGVITDSLSGQNIPLLRPLGKLCRIPKGAEFLLGIGLLGGYPVGAQNIAQAYRSGSISKEDAERMIAFCNNAGPAFLFGILSSAFSEFILPWLLWGIHILSAVAVGAVLPAVKQNTCSAHQQKPLSATKLLERAIQVMAVVCGWVILFRMALTFLERWILWAFPETVRIAIAGLLELSNGCIQLQNAGSEGLQFLLAAVFLSLGGLCVTFQTLSVTRGLSLRTYFQGKLLQTAISVFLALLAQMFFPAEERLNVSAALIIITAIICLLLAAALRASKKSSSIPAPVGV